MEKQTNERRRRETIDQAIAKQKQQQQQRKSATYLRLNCFQTFFQKNAVFSPILPHAKACLLPVEHNAWSRRDNYVTTPDEKEIKDWKTR